MATTTHEPAPRAVTTPAASSHTTVPTTSGFDTTVRTGARPASDSTTGVYVAPIVIDAGAPFAIDETPFEDDLLQLGRVRDILIDQTRALRKRWLIGDFEAGRRRGAYWGIGTAINDYDDNDALTDDNAVTAALQHIPTRLKAFTAKAQGQLINWGYALTDTALRTRADLPLDAPRGWPDGAWPLR